MRSKLIVVVQSFIIRHTVQMGETHCHPPHATLQQTFPAGHRSVLHLVVMQLENPDGCGHRMSWPSTRFSIMVTVNFEFLVITFLSLNNLRRKTATSIAMIICLEIIANASQDFERRSYNRKKSEMSLQIANATQQFVNCLYCYKVINSVATGFGKTRITMIHQNRNLDANRILNVHSAVSEGSCKVLRRKIDFR